MTESVEKSVGCSGKSTLPGFVFLDCCKKDPLMNHPENHTCLGGDISDYIEERTKQFEEICEKYGNKTTSLHEAYTTDEDDDEDYEAYGYADYESDDDDDDDDDDDNDNDDGKDGSDVALGSDDTTFGSNQTVKRQHPVSPILLSRKMQKVFVP